jgi:hypothetical protein
MQREIVVMQAEPTPKAKKHIAARVAAGKCLCCENPALKRGLCYQCYYKWRNARNTLGTAAKKAAFDSKLIRLGKLLHQQAVRAFKACNVFASAAEEL